ncbi:MAG TPA: response regulator [Thermoanaerobaculia bacterium]
MKRKNSKSLLIATENEETRTALSALGGVRTVSVSSGSEAIELLATRSFDVVVLDQALPDVTGEDILAYHRTRYPGSRNVILLVGAAPRRTVDGRGAYAVMPAPLDVEQFARVVRGCSREIAAA